MRDIWSWYGPTVPRDLHDYAVSAPDGEIGVVEGSHSDVRRGRIVVELASTSRRVVVPAGIVTWADETSRTIFVEPSKAYVADGPRLDAADDARSDELRAEVALYYASVMASAARVLPRVQERRADRVAFHPRARGT